MELVFSNLVLVHHLLQAGQGVDADIHIFVLNGTHGQLQSGLEISAFGGLLREHRQL